MITFVHGAEIAAAVVTVVVGGAYLRLRKPPSEAPVEEHVVSPETNATIIAEQEGALGGMVEVAPTPESPAQALVPESASWEVPPEHEASPNTERYIDRTTGKLYDCWELQGHVAVVSVVAGNTQGEAGDWLCHSGTTGARFVVAGSEFPERFIKLTEPQ